VDVENAGNAGQFSICVNTGFDEPSYAVVESISDDINTCLGSFHTLIGDNPDYTISPIAKPSCHTIPNGRKTDVWHKFIATNTYVRIEMRYNGGAGGLMSLWDQNGTTELACRDVGSYPVNGDGDRVLVMTRDGLTIGKEYLIGITNDFRFGSRILNYKLCLSDQKDNNYETHPRDINAAIDGALEGGFEFSLWSSVNRINASCFSNNRSDRWFNFTAPATANEGINLIKYTELSNPVNFFIQAAIYESIDLSSTVLCRDESDLPNEFNTQGVFTPGSDYLLEIDTWNQPGDFRIEMFTNNSFEGALNVNVDNNCSANAAHTLVDATADGIASACQPGGNNVANRWYRMQVPPSGQILARVLGNDPTGYGDLVDPVLSFWNEAGDTEIKCTTAFNNLDIQETSLALTVSDGVAAGDIVYLSVDIEDAADAGSFKLCLSDAVDYDWVAGAQDLIVGDCSATEEYTTVGATPDQFKPSCHTGSGTQPIANRWFKTTIPASGQLIARVLSNDPGGYGDMTKPVITLWNEALFELKCATSFSNPAIKETFVALTAADGVSPGDVIYLSVDVEDVANDGTFTVCLEDEVNYDWVAGALTLTDGNCSGNKAYTTVGATPDQLKPSCHPDGGTEPIANRWFKMQVPGSGVVDVTVICNSTLWGTMSNPVVTLWDDNLNELECEISDPINEVNTKVRRTGLTAGDWVYISVDVENAADVGEFSICVNAGFDELSYARALPSTNGCLNNQSIAGATVSPTPKPSCNTGSIDNIWYKFTAPPSGEVTVTLNNRDWDVDLPGPRLALWNPNEMDQGSDVIDCISVNDGIADNFIASVIRYSVGADNLTSGKEYLVEVAGRHKRNFEICIAYDLNGTIASAREIKDNELDTNIDWKTDSEFASLETAATVTTDDPIVPAIATAGTLGDRWYKISPNHGKITSIRVRRGYKYPNSGSPQFKLSLLHNSVGGYVEIAKKDANTSDFTFSQSNFGNLRRGDDYYLGVGRTTRERAGLILRLSTNDNSFYAFDITSLINSCSDDAEFSTVDATPDGLPGSNWHGGGPTHNRWYKFTAPATGEIKVSVDAGGAKGTQTRHQVAIWESNRITEVNSMSYATAYENDDLSVSAVGLSNGATYYISVDTESDTYSGTFTMCLEDQADYDFYEGAIDLSSYLATALGGDCSADEEYSTVFATPDRDLGLNWNNGGPIKNRWFKFVATTTEIYAKVSVSGTSGTQTRSQLALWEDNGTTEIASARYLDGNDESDVELLVDGLTVGNTYYLSVDVFDETHQGTFAICLFDDIPADLVVNGSDICMGDDGTVVVEASEPGVQYQLRLNSDDTPIGSPLNGDGNDITFTVSPNTTTEYNVLATITATGISTELSTIATVTVNDLPDNTLTVSDPIICAGEDATITLSNSEVGVSYQLRRNSNDSNIGAAVGGTGGDIDFVLVGLSTSADFNVLATVNATACQAELADLASVTVNSLPAVSLIYGTPNTPPSFTEQMPAITSSAYEARSVFSADIDGDGDMDVLSASHDDDKISRA
jgi:hypothetical protein